MIEKGVPNNVWNLDFVWNNSFISFMNMGNYVLTKQFLHKITFDMEMLPNTTSCDVMYFNMLLFKQIDGFEFHIVEGLEYEHAVHDDSLQLKTQDNCNDTLWNFLIPEYYYNIA